LDLDAAVQLCEIRSQLHIIAVNSQVFVFRNWTKNRLIREQLT
jgi:hypothetical protein